MLKNKGLNGHDGINNKIIKLSLPVISIRICSLFNQCVKSGYFPQGLKVAKVVPLFKGGLKDSLENYRPISLLSSLSKIFERIIFNRMYNFANKQKILYEKQFGFQKKKSCVDALIEFTEFIREGWDKKLVGQSCLVDLKKAFDTINHDLLLAKLEKYGFRGRILCLLNNFFTNRLQFVQTDNKISSSRSMSCGVPQGSVLGPFLFLIYKKDLPKIAEGSEVVLFADDTTICNAEKNCCDSFDSSISKMDRWFKTNGLCVNPGKTQIIKFGNNFSKDYFTFGTTVQITNVCKYLGIFVDKKLTFKLHLCAKN